VTVWKFGCCLFFLALLAGCLPGPAAAGCIGSFSEYAYAVNPQLAAGDVADGQPFGDTWQPVAALPAVPSSGSLQFSLAAYRQRDGQAEIWLGVAPAAEVYDDRDGPAYQFWIFDVNGQTWRQVPAAIAGSYAYAGDLLVTSDGRLWAATRWDEYAADRDYPALCRFNDDTGQFEFVVAVQDIPTLWRGSDQASGLVTSQYPAWAVMALDPVDNFWIFAPNDGLYQYHPDQQAAIRRLDLPGWVAAAMSPAPDGSLHIQLTDPQTLPINLDREALYQYTPETNSIQLISPPAGIWPPGRLYTDRSGNLWLGPVGYRRPDGRWVKLHPQAWRYFWQMQVEGDDRWGTPRLILESSNGYVWLQSALGQAWLDPQTHRGCWFTSEATGVLQSADQTFWTISAGHLVKFKLDPTHP